MSKYNTKEAILADKAGALAEKKASIKYADVVAYTPQHTITKAATDAQDTGTLFVKVVANSTNVLDSHMDVLVPGCYDKTIEERKGLIPHLHDHEHKISARVGDVENVYTEQIKYTDLGINAAGSTECLLMDSNVQKELNENIYNQYKSGRINQHSIGLLYNQIDLAINDQDSEKEKDFWDKYIDQIINPEKALERGYFWVVKEITVIENSAVLFGSNSATPTISVSGKDLVAAIQQNKRDQIKEGLSDTDAQLLRIKRFQKLKLN